MLRAPPLPSSTPEVPAVASAPSSRSEPSSSSCRAAVARAAASPPPARAERSAASAPGKERNSARLVGHAAMLRRTPAARTRPLSEPGAVSVATMAIRAGAFCTTALVHASESERFDKAASADSLARINPPSERPSWRVSTSRSPVTPLSDSRSASECHATLATVAAAFCVAFSSPDCNTTTSPCNAALLCTTSSAPRGSRAISRSPAAHATTAAPRPFAWHRTSPMAFAAHALCASFAADACMSSRARWLTASSSDLRQLSGSSMPRIAARRAGGSSSPKLSCPVEKGTGGALLCLCSEATTDAPGVRLTVLIGGARPTT